MLGGEAAQLQSLKELVAYVCLHPHQTHDTALLVAAYHQARTSSTLPGWALHDALVEIQCRGDLRALLPLQVAWCRAPKLFVTAHDIVRETVPCAYHPVALSLVENWPGTFFSLRATAIALHAG